jgi:hypothetical protein
MTSLTGAVRLKELSNLIVGSVSVIGIEKITTTISLTEKRRLSSLGNEVDLKVECISLIISLALPA